MPSWLFAQPSASPGRKNAMSLTLTSPAFTAGGNIPHHFTCDGDDISPPLSWSGVPDGTKSLALIVDDPDAPDPAKPERVWAHWVLYNIPPDAAGLMQGIAPSNLPHGTREGRNDWKRAGYGGPCPPVGRHRYFHKLYALDTVLPDLGHAGKAELDLHRLFQLGPGGKAELEKAMQGHIIEQAELIGTYQRK
jgi:Raf kinase inhibitor-like YbhB/YbcL family protein